MSAQGQISHVSERTGVRRTPDAAQRRAVFRRLIALMTPLALLVTVLPSRADAQQDAPPTNDLPNPYQTVEGWAKMPAGRTWGSTSAVAIAKDGVSIWVAERCGANSCAGSALDPVLEFDSTGTLVKSFGAGLMLSPHGIHVDAQGNVWVTDCACTGASPQAVATTHRGHQVFKFSPDGEVLLTLGKVGVAGDGPEVFNQPSDVVTAPNGDIFVADGHNANTNDRIVKFDPRGKFITTWGTKGSAPGEFDGPHALAFDARGRLFVGDRGNNRIQIFDQDGKFIAQWTQFSRPSGVFIDAQGTIYVADSESGSVARDRSEWTRGIRIGKVADGSVLALIPDPDQAARGTSAAEGVAVDARGHVYGAEVGPKALKRYVKR